MLATALVFVACFVGGALGTAHWLPDLAEGPVGGMAFFAVCGLIGAALGLVGLDIVATVQGFEGYGLGGKIDSLILSRGLVSILRDGGTLFGLAAIVYLLAPGDDGSSEDLPGSPIQVR